MGKGLNNNSHVNDAYCIDSAEQNIEMECGDRFFSSDLGEKYYGAVNDLQASSNHSAVVLKFPDSLVGKNSEDGAAPIYESLISNRKSPEVRVEKTSEGNEATVCQSPNNGVTAFIYETLNST